MTGVVKKMTFKARCQGATKGNLRKIPLGATEDILAEAREISRDRGLSR